MSGTVISIRYCKSPTIRAYMSAYDESFISLTVLSVVAYSVLRDSPNTKGICICVCMYV